MLSGKNVLLGVSGSIAAYKSIDVLRRLQELGADVRVVLSRNAARFMTPLTFSALTRRPVLTDEFSDEGWGAMGHVSSTENVDLVLVAPATANIIGKAASGIADDALSTVLLAASCPMIMAPAMNERMYQNKIFQRNVTSLRAAGVRFVEPECGVLACGRSGKGRLASTDSIIDAAQGVLKMVRDLAGTTVLVTSGPTREPIDAVRFISNPSSGKMGHAIAAAARDRGAEVVLISGPAAISPPQGVQFVPVTTAAEMRTAVFDHFERSRIVIMAAAVSDFRPVNPVDRKIKKENAATEIHLERTEDILMELGIRKGTRILIGFAAETDNLIPEAERKLKQKNLDMIIANIVGSAGAGFGSDSNAVTIICRGCGPEVLPLMSKESLAAHIVDKAAEFQTKQGL